MAKTLLVVDDSATMRKVFEMTFAGEDVSVVTHDGSESLLGRARDAKPALAIIDVGLGNASGYDVCRLLKNDATLGRPSVLMLYSEQNPLDEARARDAGADGSLVKPIDTQTVIDKVKQLFAQGAAAPQPAPGNVARPGRAVPVPAPPARPASAGVGSMGAPPVNPVNRAKATQVFVSSPAAPPAPGIASVPPASRAAPPPPPPVRAGVPQSTATLPPRRDTDMEIVVGGAEDLHIEVPPGLGGTAPRAGATGVASPAVSTLAADLGQRVAGLGLTPAQVEAVTALTREVVERVVWEVVPQMAETLIREEIRRLTAD